MIKHHTTIRNEWSPDSDFLIDTIIIIIGIIVLIGIIILRGIIIGIITIYDDKSYLCDNLTGSV